jgi:hypothetical protein
MTNPADPRVTLEPQPAKFEYEWHVVATCPTSQREHVTGFRSEGEAKAWIASDSKVWIAKRGY